MQKTTSQQETGAISSRDRTDYPITHSSHQESRGDFNNSSLYTTENPNPTVFIHDSQEKVHMRDSTAQKPNENKKTFKVVSVAVNDEVQDFESKLNNISPKRTVSNQILKTFGEERNINSFRGTNNQNTHRTTIKAAQDVQTSARQYGDESFISSFNQSFNVPLVANSNDQSINLRPINQDTTIEPIERSAEISQIEAQQRNQGREVRQEGNHEEREEEELVAKYQRLEKMLKEISSFKIRRSIMFCLVLFMGSILILSTSFQQDSLGKLFPLAYSFLGYCALEKIYTAYMLKSIISRKREYLLEVMDLISLIICFVLADLQLSGVDIQTRWALLLPGLNILLYIFLSKVPKTLKEALAFTRVFYMFQILLITGHLDGVMDWPWSCSLFFIWIALSVIAIFCFCFLISLLYSVVLLATNQKQLFPKVNRKTEIIGLIWLTCFSGLSVLITAALIDIVLHPKVKSLQELEILSGIITVAPFYTILLACFTVGTYKVLGTFLRHFGRNEEDLKAELGILEPENPKGIQREKKDVFIVRLTSTYFSSLKNSFLQDNHTLTKMKQTINDRRKTKLRRGKLTSKHGFIRNQVRDNKELKIQVARCLEIPIQSGILSNEDRFPSVMSAKNNNIENDKVCWSEADKVENPFESPKKDRSKQEECYICFEKQADGVLVECGHGGVCVDCAILVIQSKGECMECRAEASRVLKIDVDPKFRDIVKGREIITVETKPKEYV